MRRTRNPFRGRWRIVATDVWSVDELDGQVPAHVTFRPGRQGEMELLAIEADVDYRVGRREGKPCVEFSWEGTDDGQAISGRAWALVEKRELRGRLFIHGGDEASFVARRDGLLTSRLSGRAARATQRERWADKDGMRRGEIRSSSARRRGIRP
jgi:hypothetical protein